MLVYMLYPVSQKKYWSTVYEVQASTVFVDLDPVAIRTKQRRAPVHS